MWQNKYIGIPYKDYGRDNTGIDCWGLACLVYREEFNITLPSFSEPGFYNADDRSEIAEVIAQNTEGWAEVAAAEPGDLVLFRIMGQPSHVGIAVSATHFIHAMEGHACTIEAFDSINWKHRRVGFYKYKPQAGVNNLVAVPHPLRTQKVIMNVAYGSTIQQVYDTVNEQHNISDRLKKHITILKNSKVVPESEWGITVVQHGDTLEYRAVPGRDIGRLVLTLLVVYIAVQTGMYFGGTEATIFGTGVGTASAAQAYMIQAGVMMAGTMLVNAIMPIRPPAPPEDPGSAKSQLMYSGAANRLNPYGSIPFVLGKMRVTPPLGAQNFVRFGELTTGIVDSAEASYLDMLLVWGYGPLNIDESTMRIGEISVYDYSTTPPTPNFTKLRYITLDRKATESANEQLEFDAIYGKDVEQKYSGVELTCDGLPPTPLRTTITLGSGPWVASTTPGAFTELGFINPCDKVSVALHFPQGLRAIKTQGSGAGNSLAAPVSVTLEYRTASTNGWIPWTTQVIGGTLSIEGYETIPGSSYFTGGVDGEIAYYPDTQQFVGANRITGGAARKDAFTWTVTKDRITNGVAAWSATEPLQIRVRRNTGDNAEPNDNYRYSHTVIFQNATAISNNSPAVDPKYCKIAKTALTIQATDQFNNQMDGVNALVQTWCLDWNGSAWIEAATSNPASLFRYVLQSAANPQRILDIDVAAKIDLAQLQYWHNYCNQTRTDPQTGETYKFEFNDIVAGQRSVLDVLRDICAAGKASPALIDGRWTVVIDEPRTQVIQHFSPHNSWGFESTKMLPKFPDALKVQFYDQDKDYEQRELIIPFAGKTVANSELFETIQLPGITKTALAKDHARWHMAQVKLRPEVYTLNSDVEYLVCNRGDRVKVAHDVPMWGLGSGRIKNRISANIFDLDEEIAISSTKAYTMRVRSNTGVSTETTIKTSFNATNISRNNNIVTVTLSEAHPLQIGDVVTVNIPQVYDLSASVIEVTASTFKFNLTGSNIVSTTVSSSVVLQDGYYTRVQTSLKTIFNTTNISRNNNIVTVTLSETHQLQIGDVVTVNIPEVYSPSASVIEVTASTFKFNLTGSNIISTTVSGTIVIVDSYYTKALINYGDLFLFGELKQESQDLLVLNIEPGANKTARLTLVDYGVTDTYNIFIDYLTYSNSTIFESQVTVAPKLLINSFGIKKPTITDMISDETVMELIAPGVFAYKLQVSFTNAEDLPTTTSHVEVQIDYESAIDTLGIRSTLIEFTKGSILLSDVEESSEYKVRLRYIGSDGRIGTWTDWTVHTIVGKTNPPSSVANFTSSINQNSGKILLTWTNNPELDIKGYEVRLSDTNWGTESSILYKGPNTQVELDPTLLLTDTLWHIKAYDYANNYSLIATNIQIAIPTPSAVLANTIIATFSGNSSSGSTVTLTWTQALQTGFAIAGYKVIYGDREVFVNANTLTVNVNWLGTKEFSITTVDILGKQSTASTKSITKLIPGSVTDLTYSLNKNAGKVLLTWKNNPESDIKGYEVRLLDTGWGIDSQYSYRGSNTQVEIDPKLLVNSSRIYIKAFDYNDKYNQTPSYIDVILVNPSAVIGGSITTTFSGNSTSGPTVTLTWTKALEDYFAIAGYRVVYGDNNLFVNANTLTVNVDWLGTKEFSITTVDIIDKESTATTVSITKLLPRNVSEFAHTVNKNAGKILLTWKNNSESDIKGYEVRLLDTGWGVGSEYSYKGPNTEVEIDPKLLVNNSRIYIKAFDYNDKYSETSSYIDVVIANPTSVNINSIVAFFADTSLTSATVTLTWEKVPDDYFAVAGYKLNYNDKEIFTNSNTITLEADWVGNRVFSIITVDIIDNTSTVSSKDIAKLAPNPISIDSYRIQVIDNNVLLYWDMPQKTSLPLSHVILRKSKKIPEISEYTWETAEVVGIKSGTFTSFSELSKGDYIYWIKVVDTDNVTSEAVSKPATVAQPPDFIFNDIFPSFFESSIPGKVSRINAVKNISTSSLLLPANSSETWQEHFVSNSWNTPQNQINQGYPRYIQPGKSTATYTEVFDYETELASSQAALEISSRTLVGSVSVKYSLSYSKNGVDYSNPEVSTSIFAIDFRYIKLVIEVSQLIPGSIYEILSLSLRLDSKKITDSGKVTALLTNTTGTIVNFSKPFIDVTSIVLSAGGSAPRIAVYDFLDDVVDTTFQLVGSVCTLTTPQPHGLLVTQNIRVTFSTDIPMGVYKITAVPTANKLSFNITSGTTTTSGTASFFPNSLRVYVFDNNGVQKTEPVSWSITGF